MSDFLYTKKKPVQYHGPVSSSDFNERIEQNYADLVYLYNKCAVLDKKLAEAVQRVIKENVFLFSALTDLKDRIRSLESINTNQMSIYSRSQIDLSPFVNTGYAIASSSALEYNDFYNEITLPSVSGSSHSKIKFVNPIQGQVLPDFLETRIDPNIAGGDGSSSVIDTTPVQYAFLNSLDKVWRRSVLLQEPNPLGVSMYLYVKIPTSTIGNPISNMISLSPYPSNGVDIVRVEYTSKQNPRLDDSDDYLSLNPGYYNGQYDALGKVAPGGWSTYGSDAIVNSGPVRFFFPEKTVTAVRVLLRQKNYLKENDTFIYTYGLSDFDIRYEKKLPTGKTFIRFDAPLGKVINQITNVYPKIYNVSQSLISSVFDYRIFYPSGSEYSLNNTGTSNHVFVEVTLNMLDDKNPPVLSDLIIEADYNI